MIDHLGINCADWDNAKAFYDKVLGVLGYTRQMDFEVAIGYGKDGKPDFWIADMSAGDAAGPNREVHVAFQAADTDAVTHHLIQHGETVYRIGELVPGDGPAKVQVDATDG